MLTIAFKNTLRSVRNSKLVLICSTKDQIQGLKTLVLTVSKLPRDASCKMGFVLLKGNCTFQHSKSRIPRITVS